MLMSGQVVNAYAQPLGNRAGRARWDYEDEAPLRDARGFEMSRALADASQLTDEEDPTLANVILTNGARLYVDHAHPEYSSPEVMSPRDAVRWDKAGERIMEAAVRTIAATPGLSPVNLYKNNTDGKGSSYGTHENYLMSRATPFADIVRHLVPFFVSRQVVCGAGRVGLGRAERAAGLPAHPARRLLRGRGRARDDAEAADREHPRRAARQRRQVPPAARHHRRREPRRGRDAAQDGDDVPGAGDGRGPRAEPRPHGRPPGGRAADGVARPVAEGADHLAGRDQADRRPAAVGLPRAGPRLRRRAGWARTRTPTPSRCWSAGSRC